MEQTTQVGVARRPIALLVALAMATASVVAITPSEAGAEHRRVIVTGISGAAAQVADLVVSVGGDLLAELPIVDGVVADVPSAAVGTLLGADSVRSVTDDAPIISSSTDAPAASAPVYGDFDAANHAGSLALLNRDVLGLRNFWEAGFTGEGVDVAVVDTGIATVPGLDAGQVLHGPDLSFDSQTPWAQTDGYGHGTHLAGIIAGREAGYADAPSVGDTDSFLGVAPGARVVSVKIGDHGGAADVSQAIAAIDWVTAHRNAGGLNIRVLNLSFGYDSTQPSGWSRVAARSRSSSMP